MGLSWTSAMMCGITGEDLVANLGVVGIVLVYAVLVAVRVVGERLAVFP